MEIIISKLLPIIDLVERGEDEEISSTGHRTRHSAKKNNVGFSLLFLPPLLLPRPKKAAINVMNYIIGLHYSRVYLVVWALLFLWRSLCFLCIKYIYMLIYAAIYIYINGMYLLLYCILHLYVLYVYISSIWFASSFFKKFTWGGGPTVEKNRKFWIRYLLLAVGIRRRPCI